MNASFSSYTTESGRTATFLVAVIVAAALAATGQSTALELGDRGTVRVDLDVTAVAGTNPTLDVTIETSKTGTDGWTSLGSFTQVTAAGCWRKVFAGCDRYVRATYTIGGTGGPSFTTAINVEAV